MEGLHTADQGGHFHRLLPEVSWGQRGLVGLALKEVLHGVEFSVAFRAHIGGGEPYPVAVILEA